MSELQARLAAARARAESAVQAAEPEPPTPVAPSPCREAAAAPVVEPTTPAARRTDASPGGDRSGGPPRGSGGAAEDVLPDGAKNYTLWREVVSLRSANDSLEQQLATAHAANERLALILSGMSDRLRAQLEV